MPKKIKNVMETEFRANDRFTRNVNMMSRGMQRFNRMAARAKKALRAVGRAAVFLGRNAARIAKVGLIAMAGAATALVLSVNKLAGGMDELAKTTRAVDFDIEKFQEFRFVAEQSGVSGDKFGTMVKKFSATVGEFKGGFGTMFTALKKLDPQLAKQLKGTKGTADAFELYLEAIRRAPNATKKAALASAAFGKRMGIDMINMANLSAEAVEKLRIEMRENGVVTAEQAKKAEVYIDMMNRLKLTFKAVAVDALAPLMPLMTKGMDAVRKWVVQNKELIRQKVEIVFKNIIKYGKMAFDFLRQNVPPLIKNLKRIGKEGFSWLKENKKELKEFFGLLKDVGKIILSVASFALRNKAAILGMAVAYKGLAVSMSLLNFAGVTSGAGAATTAVGGLMGKVKGLAGMVGKGGLLVTAFAAGAAAGTAIFNEWENSLDRILTKSSNISSQMGLKAHKMSNVELKQSLVSEQKRQQETDSIWTGARALMTGRFGEWQEARKTSRNAQIDLLEEQLSRLAIPGAAPAQAQSTRTETVEKKEVEITIKDQSGKAEITKGASVGGLSLARSGAM